ncbi:ATP-binding protein [Mucilaginibacter sp.]|uniref:sensor histidine kinase n=1 Tax=Mucilaginibacter sp. TaxID=1882438 RepID=UPI0025DBFF03|nr:ATP-binding protein [Mucilaginibacter sp.]
MKIFYLVLFFILSIASANAQKIDTANINVDSLVRVALADTTKINPTPNKDSLFRLLPSAKPIAKRLKLVYQIINNGIDFSVQGLNYHYKILNWAKKNNDLVTEAVITAELGYNIVENGDKDAGVKMCFAALKTAEQTGNKQAIGIAYGNLSICYGDNNLALSKTYIEKALRFSQAANDTMSTAYALGNLTLYYLQLHQPGPAKKFALTFIRWCVDNYKSEVPRALITLSWFMPDETKLKYYRAAATIAAKRRDTSNTTEALINIGRYYLKSNTRDSALFYARKVYQMSKGSSLGTLLAPTLLLSKCFPGKADSTLKYTVEYYTIRDSLKNFNKAQRAQALAFADEQNRREVEAKQEKYVADLELYGLGIVAVFLILLAIILWRGSRRRKIANELLQEQKDQLEETLNELEATQNQLIQSEKMASLGELTAGIAHEIQNPLNFVNNFSEVSMELVDEMELELSKGDKDEAISIAADIKQNLEKIRHHGLRADSIVKGMLQHSKAGSGTKESTNINNLASEFMRLAYHGLRAKDKSFNAEMVMHLDSDLPLVNVVPQDIGRVLLNLFNNAFYAVQQKQKTAGDDYKPTVEVSTSLFTPPSGSQGIYLRVKDNGTGIADDIKEKIMQPFFTTKPTGEGTGLGLSLSYDIMVKGHGGKIDVDSEEGEYTEFAVWLPLNKVTNA